MKILLNGRELQVEGNKTILQVARENGVEIPTLCIMDEERPIGSSGLCIVKVELNNRISYPRSCATKVQEGMVIETHTEEVERARREILRMLAEEHVADGELKVLVENYGIAEVGGAHKEGFSGAPFIDFNPSACISCFRCVQACAEVKVNSVLVRGGRGANIRIVAGMNQSLRDAGCAFCGACIDACPTGALREIGYEREAKKITTICPYCGVGCAMDYYVKDGRIVYARGNPEGVNLGDDCIKGRFGWEFVHSEERLKKPLIKRNGEFVEVSWDEALDYVAKKFKEIRGKYGPDSIAGLSSAKCTNEENYLFQKFMRSVVGTNNVDHCARLCHASTVALS